MIFHQEILYSVPGCASSFSRGRCQLTLAHNWFNFLLTASSRLRRISVQYYCLIWRSVQCRIKHSTWPRCCFHRLWVPATLKVAIPYFNLITSHESSANNLLIIRMNSVALHVQMDSNERTSLKQHLCTFTDLLAVIVTGHWSHRTQAEGSDRSVTVDVR